MASNTCDSTDYNGLPSLPVTRGRVAGACEGAFGISPTAPYVTSMEVYCPWCDTSLGWKNGQGKTGITYGICEDCAERMLAEWEAELAVKAGVEQWPSAGGTN